MCSRVFGERNQKQKGQDGQRDLENVTTKFSTKSGWTASIGKATFREEKKKGNFTGVNFITGI